MPSPAGRLTRALQHRNFRLFFGGQSISLIGTWITRVATSWLVYRLTGSALLLGIAGFAGQIPTLIITPFAGVLVDRHDRRRILLMTQAGSLLQSAILAILTFTGVITVKQIIWLQVVQGVINSFDTPARQAFVSEMVEDRRDLPNAIALNSSMVNGTRIIGPSIGGLLIAGFGEGWCFTIDAISYCRGHCLDRRDARAAACPSRDRRNASARRVASRVEVRPALGADSIGAAAGRDRQHGRHPLHGADAGDCIRGLSRRAEHARPLDDGDGCRRPERRAVPRAAGVGRRPWPHHHVRVGSSSASASSSFR